MEIKLLEISRGTANISKITFYHTYVSNQIDPDYVVQFYDRIWSIEYKDGVIRLSKNFELILEEDKHFEDNEEEASSLTRESDHIINIDCEEIIEPT